MGYPQKNIDQTKMQFPIDIQYEIGTFAPLDELYHLVDRNVFIRELRRRVTNPEWLDVVIKYRLNDEYPRDILNHWDRSTGRDEQDEEYLGTIERLNLFTAPDRVRDQHTLDSILYNQSKLRDIIHGQILNYVRNYPPYYVALVSSLNPDELIHLWDKNILRYTNYPLEIRRIISRATSQEIRDILARITYSPEDHEYIVNLILSLPPDIARDSIESIDYFSSNSKPFVTDQRISRIMNGGWLSVRPD